MAKKNLACKVSERIYKRTKDLAEERGETISAILEVALSYYLNNINNEGIISELEEIRNQLNDRIELYSKLANPSNNVAKPKMIEYVELVKDKRGKNGEIPESLLNYHCSMLGISQKEYVKYLENKGIEVVIV